MPEPDPEQLMKMIDAQLAQARLQRDRATAGRTSFRIWSLVLIVGGAFAALALLQILLSQMTSRRDPQRWNGTPVEANAR